MTFSTNVSAALAFTFVLGAMIPTPLRAGDEASYALTIKDHKFEPRTLSIKAGVKAQISIHNDQKQAAEFESGTLNREKIIPPGGSAVVSVGPLTPGTYDFFDDFHRDTTGNVVVK